MRTVPDHKIESIQFEELQKLKARNQTNFLHLFLIKSRTGTSNFE